MLNSTVKEPMNNVTVERSVRKRAGKTGVNASGAAKIVVYVLRLGRFIGGRCK